MKHLDASAEARSTERRVPFAAATIGRWLHKLERCLEAFRVHSGVRQGGRTMRMRISFFEKSFANSFVKVSP